jgi:GTPase SAR1 family protein
MLFIETSAKSNNNVEQAFKKIAEIALQRQEKIEASLRHSRISRS